MTTTAVATAEDNRTLINETLRSLGLMRASDGEFARAKVNGIAIEMGDDVFASNQKTKAPALFARLLDLPLEYHGMWFTPEDAHTVGRPDIAERFCKSYYHIPNQGGKTAEDGTSCESCPVRPFIKRDSSPLQGGKKCSWRADILFNHTNELGENLDDTVWTLSLPTTSVIQLKGLSRKGEQEKGFVTELNFMQELARLSMTAFPDVDAGKAILAGATALRTGGVVAGIRVEQTKSQDGSRSFPVVVLTPVNIIFDEDVRGQLPAGVDPADVPEADDIPTDDLPFS